MDATGFLADVEAIPASLSTFARSLAGGGHTWPIDAAPRRLVLTGMGSSFFAATAAARRLRAAGVDAVADLASAEHGWPPSPELTVVVISASGTSVEVLDTARRHAGTSQVIALTNDERSPVTELADHVVAMTAGPERGGVACRSYRHTLASLLVLETQLTGERPPSSDIRRAAAATEFLLDRRDAWLPAVTDALSTTDGTWFLAPVERWSSAAQSALMVREGPRRRADACETGDWSHVDVYLTKTLDYRAVLYRGSRYEPAAMAWMSQRRSTVVSVGGDLDGAAATVRYPGDDRPVVALLTEVLVAELVAAAWWHASPSSPPDGSSD